MELQHITLSKTDLDKIPQAERTLLILLAHAANELSVLTKLFHFCARHEVKTLVEKEASVAQSMLLGRMLAGKLYECWRLLGPAFFNSKLSRDYEPLFSTEAQVAIRAIKRYFGKNNLIETVRNRHSFHYATDQVEAGYASLDENDSLNMYVSESNANTFYGFADTIAARAMLEEISPGNHSNAVERLIDETSEVIKWFNEIIGQCMAISLQKYVGNDLGELDAQPVMVDGAPDWTSLTIPYFVEIGK